MPAIVEIQNVSKRYGDIVALSGVSFQVEKGELFGLLGPNGAGKTTLLSLLSLLLEPTSGVIRIWGQSLSQAGRDLRRHIGIVPQELAIYGELTARENLAFFGRLYGLAGTELDRRVREVLAAIALEDRADERTQRFSGGMKRRLNLGVALVHQPELLLLDEPTTGVDPQSRNHIFEEIRRLNARGVTALYTSHYMEEVQALCTRVGIIDHGRLIACDSLTALLQTLPAVIRFRIGVPASATGQGKGVPPALFERLARLPGARWRESEGQEFELECKYLKEALRELLAALNDLHLDLAALEIEEPDLERVFLHLTGRALRD
jgi:ABC-2 type transport system ATP-binding protein